MSSEIQRLVEGIDDDPDPLHGDLTPAVHALVGHGLAALPHVLPLLDADDELTRLRAQRVLEGVTREWVRRREGEHVARRSPGSQAEIRAWQELWERNGSYDWRGPAEDRREAMDRWRAWLDARGEVREGEPGTGEDE